jgi:hypothetical protein
MKREMAGKIISAVRGLVENTEAVAKELNATITIAQSEEGGSSRATAHTRNATPKGRIHRCGDANFSEHLELQIVADVQDTTDESIFPCIEFNACRGMSMDCSVRRKEHLPLDVGEQFAHQPSALITILHLLLLHLFQNSCNKRVQGYRKDHDSHADERRPTEKIIKRNKCKDDLNSGSPLRRSSNARCGVTCLVWSRDGN